jgi:hypothetical protein
MIFLGSFTSSAEAPERSFYAVCLTVRDGIMLAWKRFED